MSEKSQNQLQIGSLLFYILWSSSILLIVMLGLYSYFNCWKLENIIVLILLTLLLIGLLLFPFIKKFNVGKWFSIELKELNATVEKLRDTILNFNIKNVQDIKIVNTNAPDGTALKAEIMEKSQKNFNLAYSLFKQNRIIASIENYKVVLKNDPENWIASMYLGFLYLSLRDLKIDEHTWGVSEEERLAQAIFYSTYAILKDPNHYNQFMNLAIAQKHMGGDKLTNLALINMGIAYNMLDYDQNVKANPILFCNKGKARSFMGEFAESLGLKDKARKYRAEAIEIFNNCPSPVPAELNNWKKQAEDALKILEKSNKENNP